MKIECALDEAILRVQGVRAYTVTVNGETILECLSERELDNLTIGEIKRIVEENMSLEGAKASEAIHREVMAMDRRQGVPS